MDLSKLNVPEAVVQANEFISQLDEAFLGGFARLGNQQLEVLGQLERIFSNTPLRESLSKAVTGIRQSEFLAEHFLVLANARAALQGSQHDALLAQACKALQRELPQLFAVPENEKQSPSPQLEVWCESIRQWLTELALAGFANLDLDTILPFQTTLLEIQREERMIRHAALLNGFLQELLKVFPTKGTPEIPLYRWVDLWTRAMVLSARAPQELNYISVSGEFIPFGATIHQSEVFVSLVVYGWFDSEDNSALIRTTVSAFKVAVITDNELKELLAEKAETLLEALATKKSLSIKKMPLTSTGDLLWQESAAKLGKAHKIMDYAAKLLPSLPAERFSQLPENRHPALIEELIWLEGFKIDNNLLILDNEQITLALERTPNTPDLPIEKLSKSKQLLGLLRFDEGMWQIQPLSMMLTVNRKPVFHTNGMFLPTKSKAKPALPQLRERASRLLRKKS